MKRIVLTADDLGINAQRSHGIFQCAEFGVVTNAMIIPNGSDSDAAAKRAREKNLPCGLLLNLTAEYPLSKTDDVSTLLEMNGQFLDAPRLRVLLDDGKVEPDHLERELRAQVEWIFDHHGPPTHIAGHDHIHLHPSVIHVLLPILERYGIRFVRIPCEEPLPPYGYEITPELLRATEQLNREAATARQLYAGSDILSSDHFRGSTLLGNASLRNLRHNINRLLEGTTELMTHPGSDTAYGTPFDLDPQRQTELRMLLDPSIRELLAEKKIELCSFGEL